MFFLLMLMKAKNAFTYFVGTGESKKLFENIAHTYEDNIKVYF
jgi:hypothetical protein